MSMCKCWIIGLVWAVILTSEADTGGYFSMEEYVTMQAQTPPEVLALLANTEDISVLCTLLKQPNCTPEILTTIFKKFAEKKSDEADVVFSLISRHPKVPSELLVYLAYSSDIWVRRAVGWNSKTPGKTLRTLSQDPNEQVRSAVGRNANTPLEILVQLAQDPSYAVKMGVAVNPRLSLELLQKLGQIDEELKSQVASNSSLSLEYFTKLSKDPSEQVRRAIVSNFTTPVNILLSLAKDPSEQVRCLIARNLNTPVNTLLELTGDTAPVRANIAANPNITPDVLQKLLELGDFKQSLEVRVGIASNPNIPPEYLSQLAGDPHVGVKICLANNPKTPPQILATLASDEIIIALKKARSREVPYVGAESRLIEEVICAVAMNPHTPAERLERLAEEDYQFQCLVAANPNTPLKILQKFAKEPRFMWIRESVASNPRASAKILDDLAEDSAPPIRYQAVLHANTSREALTKLSQDLNQYIRLVAQKRLAN